MAPLLGKFWCALAGVMLLFAPGWAVKLAGLCLIAFAADTGNKIDVSTTLIVCAVGAIVAFGFRTWLRWVRMAQASSNVKTPTDNKGDHK